MGGPKGSIAGGELCVFRQIANNMEEAETKKYTGRILLSFIFAFLYLSFFQAEILEELLPPFFELLGNFIVASILMYMLIYVLEGVWCVVKNLIGRK